MSEARDMLAGAVADLCGGDSHGDHFTVDGITGTFYGVFNGLNVASTPTESAFDVQGGGTLMVEKSIKWVPKAGQLLFVRGLERIVDSITEDSPSHWMLALTVR